MPIVVAEEIKTKACTKCKIVKPLDSFYGWKFALDGKRDWCTECWAEYKRLNPHQQRQARTRWRLSNPERVKIEGLFNYYFTIANKLMRPTRCSVCGVIARTQAHHPDINKPFDVLWCCQTCHRQIERGEVAVQPDMIICYPFGEYIESEVMLVESGTDPQKVM